MAHNSKRNRRHTTVQDGDDYVYPTKKIRETKTRNRKHDRNLIKAGLIDQAYREEDSFEDNEEHCSEEATIMAEYNEMIMEQNALEEEMDDYDSHQTFDDINDEYEDACNDIYGIYEEDY